MQKDTTLDYYNLVCRIRSGRSPSIFHQEHEFYWRTFPKPPVFTVYNTTFNQVIPFSHCVDCSQYGQVHFWVRVGGTCSPALVVFHFTEAKAMKEIKYYFFGGLMVDLPERDTIVKITNPDAELFHYVLAGFIQGYLNRLYTFEP